MVIHVHIVSLSNKSAFEGRNKKIPYYMLELVYLSQQC